MRNKKEYDFIIYCTTNLLNFRKYIGYDSYNDPNYFGSGSEFKKDLIKYGKQNFKKQTLQHCNNFEDMYEAERYWIAYFGAQKSDLFYNICKGGNGGGSFINHPNKEEIRRKLSLAHKGKPTRRKNFHQTKEAKEKISKASKGRKKSKTTIEKWKKSRDGWKHSSLSKEKMSKSHLGKSTWNKGKNLSEDHKLKLSLSKKGKKQSKESIEKRRLSITGLKRSEQSKENYRLAWVLRKLNNK